MNEEWKDIIRFEGLYQISSYGRVRRLPRNGTTNEIKLLKPRNNKGYLEVYLCKDGKGINKKVHRLVAYAFIPNDDLFKTEINHIDENPMNNNVNNLEWCDAKYNSNYGTRNERISKRVNQYDLTGNFLKTWKSAAEIERQMGFTNQCIRNCCKEKQKTAYDFIWKYA